MRSRNKTALNVASSLATVALALHSFESHAQDDPFALPARPADECNDDSCQQEPGAPDPTGFSDRETYYADVIVNGERQPGIAALRGSGEGLEIASGFALAAGIVRSLPQTEYVALATIDGLTHSFDTSSYTLSIEMPLYSTGPNLVSMTGTSSRQASAATPITAMIVDYDLSAQYLEGNVSLSGLVAPRLVRDNIALETGFLFDTDATGGERRFTRLDTALTIRVPQRMYSATVGDFVSQVPNGLRAVRMGGLRIGTDFDLRPDIVTQPLPDFVGDVAVPTDLDILVNSRRIGGAELVPGEFTVRDIPVPVGRSEVGVITRDSLGRETIRTVEFYSSRDLLAPHLQEFAVNVGAIRRRYGLASNDYGRLAMSASYRRGISSRFTGTVTAELAGNVQNVGALGDLVLGNLGIVSIALRASRADYFPSGEQGGTYFEIGFESVSRSLSYSLQYRDVSRYFADIASANGDAPPPSLIAANIGFDLRDHGKLRFSAIQHERRNPNRLDEPARITRLVSANYRHRLSDRLRLSVDASYRQDRRGTDGFSFLLGLSMSLGGARYGQLSYAQSSGQGYLQGGYYDPDILPGDTGYSLVAGIGSTHRIAASVSRREHWARAEAQAEIVQDVLAMRANLRGSLIYADGALFAAEGGSDTYILADANGIEDLEIQRENRPAGTTNRGGRLLISQVPGYNPVKIGLDPAQLPTDVSAGSTEEYVAAAPRSVARVSLDVARYVPLKFALVDPRGQRFSPGTLVIATPSRSEYIVGLDGRVEINADLQDTGLEIIAPGGDVCRAEVSDLMATEDGRQVLRCFIRTRTISFEGGEAAGSVARAANRMHRVRDCPMDSCRRALLFDKW